MMTGSSSRLGFGDIHVGHGVPVLGSEELQRRTPRQLDSVAGSPGTKMTKVRVRPTSFWK